MKNALKASLLAVAMMFMLGTVKADPITTGIFFGLQSGTIFYTGYDSANHLNKVANNDQAYLKELKDKFTSKVCKHPTGNWKLPSLMLIKTIILASKTLRPLVIGGFFKCKDYCSNIRRYG